MPHASLWDVADALWRLRPQQTIGPLVWLSQLPASLPNRWSVDCRNVGRGLPALMYLSRYLYRGVFNEHNLVALDRQRRTVTFRYIESSTGESVLRTLSAECHSQGGDHLRNSVGRSSRLCLLWEDNGFVLYYKALAEERFKWPGPSDVLLSLTGEQISWLLDGYDISLLQGHKKLHYTHLG